MLEGILVPAKATIAKKIPLAQSPTKDFLFWPFTTNGQYNCKLGYRFLKDLEVESVRLNLINHFIDFIPCQFACNSALRNPVFRWESCKGSV